MNKTYLMVLASLMLTALVVAQDNVPLIESSAVVHPEGILELPTAQVASVDNLVPPQTIRQLSNHTARQQWGRTLLVLSLIHI